MAFRVCLGGYINNKITIILRFLVSGFLFMSKNNNIDNPNKDAKVFKLKIQVRMYWYSKNTLQNWLSYIKTLNN